MPIRKRYKTEQEWNALGYKVLGDKDHPHRDTIKWSHKKVELDEEITVRWWAMRMNIYGYHPDRRRPPDMATYRRLFNRDLREDVRYYREHGRLDCTMTT